MTCQVARTNFVQIRLSDEEMGRLKAYAEEKEYTYSEILRDHIKNLPLKKR